MSKNAKHSSVSLGNKKNKQDRSQSSSDNAALEQNKAKQAETSNQLH